MLEMLAMQGMQRMLFFKHPGLTPSFFSGMTGNARNAEDDDV